MYFLELSHNDLLEEVLDKLRESDRDKLLKAYGMALRAHEWRGQRAFNLARGEGSPPIDHPVRVMYSLYKEQNVRSAEILAAALLHDVLEVSDIEKAEIEAEFGAQIASWVELLTRKKGIDRKEYAMKIKEAPYEVFLIEMAARLDNLRTAHRKNQSLQPYFNETHNHYLLFGEHRSKEHPSLRVYTDAMRMMMEGD